MSWHFQHFIPEGYYFKLPLYWIYQKKLYISYYFPCIEFNLSWIHPHHHCSMESYSAGVGGGDGGGHTIGQMVGEAVRGKLVGGTIGDRYQGADGMEMVGEAGGQAVELRKLAPCCMSCFSPHSTYIPCAFPSPPLHGRASPLQPLTPPSPAFPPFYLPFFQHRQALSLLQLVAWNTIPAWPHCSSDSFTWLLWSWAGPMLHASGCRRDRACQHQ